MYRRGTSLYLKVNEIEIIWCVKENCKMKRTHVFISHCYWFKKFLFHIAIDYSFFGSNDECLDCTFQVVGT